MSKSSDTIKEKFGNDFYKEIGKKGGEATKANGTDFEALGKAGGDRTLQKYGREYFSEIARLPRRKK